MKRVIATRPSGKLSEGLTVTASIRARLFGTRVLTLDADVTMLPPPTEVEVAAPARRAETNGAIGAGLTEALAEIDASASDLSEARRSTALAAQITWCRRRPIAAPEAPKAVHSRVKSRSRSYSRGDQCGRHQHVGGEVVRLLLDRVEGLALSGLGGFDARVAAEERSLPALVEHVVAELVARS